MALHTNISWCDSTWNWAWGCDKVSPGCANCYITDSLPFRFGKMKHGDPRKIASDRSFDQPLRWNLKPWICDTCGNAFKTPTQHHCPSVSQVMALPDEVNWHRRRVFSLSLGDWLDEEIPIVALARAMQIIYQCQNIDFLLCSKRLENWENLMFKLWDDDHCKYGARPWIEEWLDGVPPKNVWVIASVENQPMAEKRIPELLQIPAVVRGLSCEPLLEPVNLGLAGIVPKTISPSYQPTSSFINWVIVGGESETSKKCRPCKVEWIRNIKDQCQAAGVPCFVKQLGTDPRVDLSEVIPATDIDEEENADPADIAAREHWRHNVPMHLKHKKGGEPSEWPADLRVREFPKSVYR